MKRILVLAALAACLPAQASAMCYTVFGPKQVVFWRGSNAPFDLSGPISDTMRKRVPSGHLVITDDTYGCTPVGQTDFFGPVPGMTVQTQGQLRAVGMQGAASAGWSGAPVEPGAVMIETQPGRVAVPLGTGEVVERGRLGSGREAVVVPAPVQPVAPVAPVRERAAVRRDL